MYICEDFFIFYDVFFAVSSPNPDTVSEWPKRTVSNALQVLSTNTSKCWQNGCMFPPLSPQAPSAIIVALVYRSIPSDLRSRPEQSHHLPGALLPRWLQAVCRESNGASPPSSQQKGRFRSLFIIVFWDFGPKWCFSIIPFPSLIYILSNVATLQRRNVATSTRKR